MGTILKTKKICMGTISQRYLDKDQHSGVGYVGVDPVPMIVKEVIVASRMM